MDRNEEKEKLSQFTTLSLFTVFCSLSVREKNWWVKSHVKSLLRYLFYNTIPLLRIISGRWKSCCVSSQPTQEQKTFFFHSRFYSCCCRGSVLSQTIKNIISSRATLFPQHPFLFSSHILHSKKRTLESKVEEDLWTQTSFYTISCDREDYVCRILRRRLNWRKSFMNFFLRF